MSQSRPESRIGALEKRASILEAQIGELASDSAEELKAVRQDIKQLEGNMKASFLQIGDAFNLLLDRNIETVKTMMATKEDLSKLEVRLSNLETTQAEILALLKQNRPDK